MGRRNRSNSHGGKPPKSRDDLWNNCFEKDVGGGAIVQMDGIGSDSHTVFSRMLPTPTGDVHPVTVGTVVDAMVGEGWKAAAKEILEKHVHIEKDSYPSAKELLKLGAVWLLNETQYIKGEGAHAHRLTEADVDTIPKWEDMTLRVHYAPERFHASYEVDWSKNCRGLLIGHTVEAFIGNDVPHVPLTGLPDLKDGVIVYENPELGFAVINKPGSMPIYATIDNHLEDVVTMFSDAMRERRKNDHHCKKYVSVPSRIDTETSGLVAVATRKEFCSYMSKLVDKKLADNVSGIDNMNFVKKYKCLVCVKNADTIDQVEKFQQTGTVITHYCCPQSPAPKRFHRHKPGNNNSNGGSGNNNSGGKSGGREHVKCQMRILKVGDDQFRAACVSSKYGDSADSNLAHRLWGFTKEHPAEDLHTKFVMELEVELLTNRPHQLRGQLAALGLPIVGDHLYGGGQCEYRSHMHGWNRMAVQCSELSFMEPKWADVPDSNKKESSTPTTTTPATSPGEDTSEQPTSSSSSPPRPATPPTTTTKCHKGLVPSDKRCHFRLNTAWWNEYLHQYEMYHQTY